MHIYGEKEVARSTLKSFSPFHKFLFDKPNPCAHNISYGQIVDVFYLKLISPFSVSDDFYVICNCARYDHVTNNINFFQICFPGNFFSTITGYLVQWIKSDMKDSFLEGEAMIRTARLVIKEFFINGILILQFYIHQTNVSFEYA